jgi:ABC transporter
MFLLSRLGLRRSATFPGCCAFLGSLTGHVPSSGGCHRRRRLKSIRCDTLLTPDSGAAVIAGHDVLREPDKVRAKIGLAGQSVTMDKYRERPGEPDDDRPLYRFSRRDAGLRSQELIAHFDLAPAADRPVSTYSGGMRRRLDLAASLWHRRCVPLCARRRRRYRRRQLRQLPDPGRDGCQCRAGRHDRGGRRRNRHLQRDRGPVPFTADVPLRNPRRHRRRRI